MAAPFFSAYDAISVPSGTWIKPGGRVAAYVRSTGAQEGDDYFATSGMLVSTISEGVSRCRSGMNDLVYVLDNHVESISGADGWSDIKAGAQIISCVRPGLSSCPTLTFDTATTAQLAIDVADVTLAGFNINMAGLDNIVNPFLVTAAGFSFCNNFVTFQSATASAQPVDGIILGAGAHNVTIDDNTFLSDDAGEANAGSPILIGASAALGLRNVKVRRNYIVAAITEATSDALIMVATSGSGIVIKDNDLHVLSTTGDSAIRSISATVNGVIARNNIRLTEDLTAPNGVILAGGTWLVYDNRVSAGNGFAVQTPATDS